MGKFRKDPDAELDYGLDWSAWLVDDQIINSEWFTPTELTVGTGTKAPTFDLTTTKIWLSGGEAGQSYRVTNRITTAAGRIEERTLQINVGER